MTDLITTRQAAATLGLSLTWIAHLHRTGELRGIKLANGSLVFRRRDVDAVARRRTANRRSEAAGA